MNSEGCWVVDVIVVALAVVACTVRVDGGKCMVVVAVDIRISFAEDSSCPSASWFVVNVIDVLICNEKTCQWDIVRIPHHRCC